MIWPSFSECCYFILVTLAKENMSSCWNYPTLGFIMFVFWLVLCPLIFVKAWTFSVSAANIISLEKKNLLLALHERYLMICSRECGVRFYLYQCFIYYFTIKNEQAKMTIRTALHNHEFYTILHILIRWGRERDLS